MGSDQESNAAQPSEGAGNSRAGWWLLGAAAVLLAGSVGYTIYSGQGEGEETALSADAEPSIEDLRAAAENSDGDANAWAALGFAYSQREDWEEAAAAYERAVEFAPNEAALWSALGEMRAYGSERDPLPPEALEAFEKAIALDPQDPRARYFMAVKQDIAGEHEAALASWLALLSDTPPGAPWEGDLVRTIEQVGAINDIDIKDRLATVMEARAPEVLIPGSGSAAGDAASSTVRGPSAAQVAEASRMPPGEQQQMIAGMVNGLEERLKSEPGDLDGWVMLIRSRMNLGETGKARDALAKAIAANPGDEAELRRQAAQLGL